jgi:hypothetical protein
MRSTILPTLILDFHPAAPNKPVTTKHVGYWEDPMKHPLSTQVPKETRTLACGCVIPWDSQWFEHLQKLGESALLPGQKAMSEQGVPEPYLNRALTSGSMPREVTLRRLAAVIGVPYEDITGEWVS